MARFTEDGVCPHHGSKFLKRVDNAYYCHHIDERGRKCFYHPDGKKAKVPNSPEKKVISKPSDPNPDQEPDVLSAIWTSWELSKAHIYRTRKNAKKNDEPSEQQEDLVNDEL